jgi:hypothetical protein
MMRDIAPHGNRRKERALGQAAKDIVRVTAEERHPLPPLVVGPRVARAQARRARRRLQAEGPHGSAGPSAAAFEVGASPLHRLRPRWVAAGREAARPRPPPARPQPRPRAGAPAARRGACACRQAPAGRASGTRRLRAEKRVARERGEASGRASGRPTLTKMPARPGCRSHGADRRRRPPPSSARGQTPWRGRSARRTRTGRGAAARKGPRQG